MIWRDETMTETSCRDAYISALPPRNWSNPKDHVVMMQLESGSGPMLYCDRVFTPDDGAFPMYGEAVSELPTNFAPLTPEQRACAKNRLPVLVPA